jgi:enoyl-CoA hydratase
LMIKTIGGVARIGEGRGMLRSKMEDGVALITIERVDKANALPEAVKQGLAIEIKENVARDEVKAIVLTGQGERAFCAGSDISEMRTFNPDQMYRMLGAERAMYRAAIESPKPVVAAVNGVALGAGMILVMACDYAVASATARFGTPELTIGVSAPLEGFLLPWIVGLGWARAMFYTGRQLNAEEALRLGLIQEVTEPDSCLSRAIEAARRIAALPGDGFRIQKRLLYRLIAGGDLESVIEASRYAASLQFVGQDTADAMGRFLVGRAAGKSRSRGLDSSQDSQREGTG